jgi:hypothetical protein
VLAHIVGGGPVPAYAAWLAALTMFAGVVVVAVWWRVRLRRRIGGALAAVGLLANVGIAVAQPSVPIPPGYGIRLAAAAETTTPVLVRVCGLGSGATAPPVPGSGRLLLVFADGRQVAELRSDTVAVQLATGRHRLTAQLITSDHRAFVPAVTADATVTVTGSGAIPAPASCAVR